MAYDEDEWVGVGKKALTQFVLTMAFEGDIETPSFDTVDTDEILDGLSAKNVEHVEGYSEFVEVGGTFTVHEAVGRIPASGGGKFDPPTNPPETITEKQEVGFTTRFFFEDMGHAETVMEIM